MIMERSERIKNNCPQCKRLTNHNVVKEYLVSIPYSVNDDSYESSREESKMTELIKYYQIVQCCGCDIVSFKSFEKYHNGDDEFTVVCFPTWDENFLDEREFSSSVPTEVKKIYTETIRAFNQRLPILCAAGIRATIEAICSSLNIYEGNLLKKIKALHEHRHITNNEEEKLSELRYMGNLAIHEIVEPVIEDLKVGIEIIEHILTSVYEWPQRRISVLRRL